MTVFLVHPFFRTFAAKCRELFAAFAFIAIVCAALVSDRADALVQEGAEGIVVQVRSAVEVDGKKSEITLGDLVVMHGLDADVLAAIQNVRLADTPKAGESRSFTAMGLEQVFRQHLRDLERERGEKLTLRIPTRVTVVRQSFHLRPEDIQAELKRQMAELCSDCVFEISNLSLPALPTTVTTGSSWTLKMRHEMPKGTFSLPIEVANDDGSKRSYWISGSVTISKNVPVAGRSLQVGERMQAQDFSIQMKDITFSTDVAASESDLATSVAARQIAAGQIVWRSSLRREMAVKNGDIVKVVAGQDGWQITIDGIAQGSAYIGDSVNVKIPRTQKLISGLLTEKGVVEVH